MSKQVKTALGIFIAILLIGGGLALFGTSTDNSDTNDENQTKVVIHKSPTCGCCGAYGSYLDRLDYDTEIVETNNLNEVKNRFQIPQEVWSCHTMEIGDYVVEGHVPEEAISKLLTLQPDIKGIGLADMPAGSPGMPGPKTEDFIIYEINQDGSLGEVFMTL